MEWTYKYPHEDENFLILFDTEQDYIDFVFTQIVMFNYGVHVPA